MLSKDGAAEALARITSASKPFTTLRVWNAILGATAWGSSRLEATVDELAAVAKVPHAEVRRALPHLAKMGILRKTGRGRYDVNPNIAWRGDLTSRALAAASDRWGVPVTSL